MQRPSNITDALRELGPFSAVRAHVSNLEDSLDKIHAILDGREWNSDTPVLIAKVLRDHGYVIRDLIDKEA